MATKKPPQNTSAIRCSFCRKSVEDVGPLVDAPQAAAKICRTCATQAVGMFEEHQGHKKRPATRTKADQKKVDNLPTPMMVYEHMNRFVVGQDRAKKRLAVGVTNHLKRILDMDLRESNQMLVTDPEVANTVIGKSNILLVGPTGTGKTLLAKSLAEYLNVPFAIGDATTLTEAGYVGEDVENLLLKLCHAADFDIEKVERGIIYIDEIDKIHRTGHNVSITRDVSGEGVQQSLLKMIEGTISNVPPQGGRKHPEQNYIQINTSNILFICGGAFVGIEDIISRRVGKSAIGFGRGPTADTTENRTALLRQLTPEDLEQYGLIPELVGRLPVVTTLDELTIEDLIRVLREPEDAIIRQYRKLALMQGVDFRFTDEAMTLIAQQAKAKGTGARGLRSVMEEFLTDLMFELPNYQKGIAIITPEVVRGEAPPQMEVKGEAA